MPRAKLEGLGAIEFAITCNKQPVATSTARADMAALQAQLATLVNEVLLSASSGAAALPAGCLLLTSIPGTQLSTFAAGDLVEATFGNACACGHIRSRMYLNWCSAIMCTQARCSAVWLCSGMQLTQCVSLNSRFMPMWNSAAFVAADGQRGSIAARRVRQSFPETDGEAWLHHDQVDQPQRIGLRAVLRFHVVSLMQCV